MSVATTLSHDTSIVQGLFIEMFLTALLVITILMLAVEKSRTTFIAPVGIGLALFVAHLTGMSISTTLPSSSTSLRRYLDRTNLTSPKQESTSPAPP